MIQIFIENGDGAHDLFASVMDLNTNPPASALDNQRINRNSRTAVSVQDDGNGNCLINVHTISVDDATAAKDFNNQATQANGVIVVDVF